MGLDLYWRPKKSQIVFQECSGSTQALKIKSQFGDSVTSDDLLKLRHFYEATGEAIYKEIADTVSAHGDIYLEVT